MMFTPLFYSVLGIIGFGFVFHYAVSALPYLVILSVSSCLMFGAFLCGDFTSRVMMVLSGFVILSVGFFYIRELVCSSTAKQVVFFSSVEK